MTNDILPETKPHVNGTLTPDLIKELAAQGLSRATQPTATQQAATPKSSQTGGEAPQRLTLSDLLLTLQDRAKDIEANFLHKSIERDELGCAELLCEIAKGLIVYDRAGLAWYWWNGLYWVEDKGGNLCLIAGDVLSGAFRAQAEKQYSRQLSLEGSMGNKPSGADKALLEEIKAKVKEAEGQARDLYRLAYVKNVLVFAGATQLLGLIGDEWDRKINLLGVNNGVIDLTTGKLTKPNPADYIRTVAPVDYQPGAQCPMWKKALLEIFAHDPAMVAYIQTFLGYALSGTCHESDFPVWFGKHGRNGKEWILERARAVMGSKLAGPVDPEILLKSKSEKGKNGATPAMMVLQGRRLAWASEVNEGRHFDLAALKDLSGGHILTGRHLHQGQTEWKRTHTIIMLTNHKPHVSGGGGGAEWERIKLVPFTESFVSEPSPDNPHEHLKDPALGEKIDSQELSGILNWLIEGCLEWRKNGLQAPPAIREATAQYKADEDTLGRFMDECCVKAPNAKVPTKDLYEKYVEWCRENNDSAMGSKTFGQKIEDKGFSRFKSGAVRGFNGIGLLVKRISLEGA